MPDIEDGESVEMKGSAKDPYILKNVGGVYSCTCPAWRTQSLPIERRTCKHLKKYRGEAAESERFGGELPSPAASRRKPASKASSATSNGSTTDADAASDVPGFLLAHSWDNFADLSGWWMSEKLDGVRAYWDGTQFISRQGNVYLAPEWFLEDLPRDVHLDGELWIARKAFNRTVSIVRRQDKSKDWQEVTYVVFDAPKVDDVFEARMAYLKELLDETQPKYARPHVQERCRDSDHLKEELKRVEATGGEGLMLREPKSNYETGRSSTLLKVKSFHDAEARVLEYLPGTGKHKGRMGALSVELKDGTKFAIGTGFSDKQRENPPAVGSIVTFRYQELTDRGVPRFPSFVRERKDLNDLPDQPMADVLSDASKTTVQVSVDAASTSNSTTDEVAIESKAPPEKTAATTSSAASKPHPAPSNVLNFAPPKSKTATDMRQPKPSSRDSTPRYFEFVEDKSSKFWSIWRDGLDVTVSYGRIGTSGQEKTKSFNDEDAAKSYYADIIDEKTEKGYVEKTGPGGEEVDGDWDDSDDDIADEGDIDDGTDDDDDDDDDDENDDQEPMESFAPPVRPSSMIVSRDARYSQYATVGSVQCYCLECCPASEQQISSSSSTQIQASPPSSAPVLSATATQTKTATATGAKIRYFEFVEGNASKFWSIWMEGSNVIVKYGRIGTNGQEKTKTFTNQNDARRYYDDIIEEKLEKGYEEKD
ncbi:MAG: DNA ligase [Candidatus Obscuribacterales bacterium]|nr:DNA ligase [Candidatus Obscuribacterales bacterium]